MNKVRMILISCLATAWSTGLVWAEKAPRIQPIFKVDEAPVIDGKLDDSCWKKTKGESRRAMVSYSRGGEKGRCQWNVNRCCK